MMDEIKGSSNYSVNSDNLAIVDVEPKPMLMTFGGPIEQDAIL